MMETGLAGCGADGRGENEVSIFKTLHEVSRSVFKPALYLVKSTE